MPKSTQKKELLSWHSPLLSGVAVVFAGYSACGTNQTASVNVANRHDSRVDAVLQSKIITATTKGLDDIRGEVQKGIADSIRSQEAAISVRLDGIEKRHEGLERRIESLDDTVKKILLASVRRASSLPPQRLAEEIPIINAVYGVASSNQITIPPDLNNTLRLSLANVESNTPEFWQLASTVVTVASRSTVNELPPSLQKMRMSVDSNTIVNAHILLDGIRLTNNICRNCLIEYHGGQTVVGGNVFIDCKFILRVSAPSSQGQTLVRQLLRSDLKNVAF